MIKQCLLILTILLLASYMVYAAAEKPMLYLEDNVLAAGNYNVSMDSSDISLIIRIEAGKKQEREEIVPKPSVESNGKLVNTWAAIKWFNR